jgi:hypothetical protein
VSELKNTGGVIYNERHYWERGRLARTERLSAQSCTSPHVSKGEKLKQKKCARETRERRKNAEAGASQVGTGSGSDRVLPTAQEVYEPVSYGNARWARLLRNLSIRGMLTDEFISKNTSFRTVHEFFVFPFALEDCTSNELGNYVKSRTNFQRWKEMLSSARISNPRSGIRN